MATESTISDLSWTVKYDPNNDDLQFQSLSSAMAYADGLAASKRLIKNIDLAQRCITLMPLAQSRSPYCMEDVA